MANSAQGWLDRIVGICIGLTLAALALYVAVQLIQAVWVWLVIIGSCLVVGAGVVALLRGRPGSW